ncbi:MAG: glycosyltransferase family 2 protein [Candidatus Falkowbacteria bacterium]
MDNIFISICIPNYNRPDELLRLLKTIDSIQTGKIEIVICEDKSPKMLEVRGKVRLFCENTQYKVNYVENEVNLGFDKNLRACILNAHGKWVIYMGNDDEFVPGALDQLINFLTEHENLGYILKSHYFIHKNGKKERFRYYDGIKFFEPGLDTYIQMFRKSVFISGFTIRKELTESLLKDDFDGTLLFQLYLLAEVCLKYPAAYFDVPLTQQYDEGTPEFGNAASEKALYTPGSITVDNSIKFLSGYFKITRYIDEKHKFNSTVLIAKDMSKYFYPSLAIQRNKGISSFLKYVKELNRLGFNVSLYYYIYIGALLIFGKNICDNTIRILKNIIGKTPKL